ncbi:peroxiredoxin [Tersicoccus solisilvae]|uniref:Peroxiredoxin n=1 Tax=Tersicoccus solisilvae TaxID=1882339 RepID=A0ABQ1PDR9_9MICC|nr:redoxin domain-containing protein [Tersicoccus solisilvae]GGC95229.1 peroxiredoxin [Tersicoccus solisilvae]
MTPAAEPDAADAARAGRPGDGFASLPDVGAPAPGFALANQHGEPVVLTDLRGTPVVLVFFPWAFSRVCGDELRELRDALDVADSPFAGRDVRLMAVSVDSKFALRALAEAEALPFDLLSDVWPHGEVARRYGVFDDERGSARRGSFVIDADGVLRARLLSDATHPRSMDEYRRALASLDA